ncbi:MAG: nuclear transport factor 2 family protein [Xanthobacteraceae bacterium]|nr:MAG: nuclear transport factor 2 family protein [Xanthobacteraceae bacterium]
MTATSRELLQTYYDAVFAGDTKAAVSLFDENIVYTCFAPVNVFPYLGYRKGKTAASDAVAALHRLFHDMSYTVRILVGEGDQVASQVDVRLRKRNDNRMVQLYFAHFTRMKNGLIVEHLTFLDSCDILEQIIGYELDFTRLLGPKDIAAINGSS